MSNYNLENISLIKYLIDKWIRKNYLKLWWFYNYNSIVEEVKKLKEEFIWYSYEIIFNKDYWFWVFFFKDKNYYYNWLYPDCCIKSFDYQWWDINRTNFYFTKISILQSKFVCPMLTPLINDNHKIDFMFMPWYKIHSLDCRWSILYMQNLIDFIRLSNTIELDNLFCFLKKPFFITKKYILIFNGFYDKWFIYYKWFFMINYNLDWKFFYSEKSLDKKLIKWLIIPWEKLDLSKNIILKWIWE